MLENDLWRYIFGKKQKPKSASVMSLPALSLGAQLTSRIHLSSQHSHCRTLSTVPEMEVRETDRESPLEDPDLRDICYHSLQKTPRDKERAR